MLDYELINHAYEIDNPKKTHVKNCLPAMPFLLPTTTNAEKDVLRPSVPVMFMTVLNYQNMTT